MSTQKNVVGMLIVGAWRVGIKGRKMKINPEMWAEINGKFDRVFDLATRQYNDCLTTFRSHDHKMKDMNESLSLLIGRVTQLENVGQSNEEMPLTSSYNPVTITLSVYECSTAALALRNEFWDGSRWTAAFPDRIEQLYNKLITR